MKGSSGRATAFARAKKKGEQDAFQTDVVSAGEASVGMTLSRVGWESVEQGQLTNQLTGMRPSSSSQDGKQMCRTSRVESRM